MHGSQKKKRRRLGGRWKFSHGILPYFTDHEIFTACTLKLALKWERCEVWLSINYLSVSIKMTVFYKLFYLHFFSLLHLIQNEFFWWMEETPHLIFAWMKLSFTSHTDLENELNVWIHFRLDWRPIFTIRMHQNWSISCSHHWPWLWMLPGTHMLQDLPPVSSLHFLAEGQLSYLTTAWLPRRQNCGTHLGTHGFFQGKSFRLNNSIFSSPLPWTTTEYPFYMTIHFWINICRPIHSSQDRTFN